MTKKTLCIATRNQHKAKEMAAALSEFWEVKCSADYPEMDELEVIDETGDTFLANAAIKAEATSRIVPDYVLADDSGLEVDVLDGAPGVFSARYGGIPSSDERNNAKLLEELKRVGALQPEQRRARFRCVLVLAKEGNIIDSFNGACEGTISTEAHGTHGFGYDPLFVPLNFAKSFGQLPDKTKATLSHRALALKQFIAWCKETPAE